VRYPIHKSVLDGIGHRVQKLLLQAGIVDGFVGAVPGGEQRPLPIEVSVDLAGDQ